MLAYTWKMLGWFLAGVAVALGFLLVPLQVAAERKKLDRTTSEIAQAHRDIRALETEFDTRANLAQLEKWNGDTLRLGAPAATQFVADEAALASIDVNQSGQGGAATQMASLIVPSMPDGPAAAQTVPAVVSNVAATASAMAKPASPAPSRATNAVAVRAPSPAPSPASNMVRAVAQVRDRTMARKDQAVALLDRKLLNDSTIGDLISGARAETRGLR